MPLDIAPTILASAPYFDDYTESKNFHRVLFRPAVAVQVRELNQVQAILQNQIERLGNHVFKNGSIVKGCPIEYIPDLEFVSVADTFNTNSALSVEDAVFENAVAIGNTSDVHAVVFSTVEGYQATDSPSKLFIRYTKPAANGQRTFTEGEHIKFYSSNNQTYIETILLTTAANPSTIFTAGDRIKGMTSGAKGYVVAANSTTLSLKNVRFQFANSESIQNVSNSAANTTITAINYNLSTMIDSIQVLSTNNDVGSYGNSMGGAYGAVVGEGVIFHKGHFIRVDDHKVVVNEANNNPAGMVLGFVTEEEIVTENADSSLYDNASGAPNENAPGAHRLKLTSTLVPRAANGISNTEIFFPIVEFSSAGPIFEKTDPTYNLLNEEFSRRTFEESGHYIVKAFAVSTNTNIQDANNFLFDISPGTAYVRGNRVETIKGFNVEGRRGIDTVSYSDQIVTTVFGNYIEANEVRGFFPTDSCPEVALYDTAQDAVSEGDLVGTVPEGAVIGYANLRAMISEDTTNAYGSQSCVWKMYLFNIRMNSGQNFKDVRSVCYMNGGNADAMADTVLDVDSNTVLLETNYAPVIFSLGARAVASLKDANNASDSSWYYTAANTNATLANTGLATLTIPNNSGIIGFTANDTTSELKITLTTSANIDTISVGTANTSANTANVANASNLFFPGEYIIVSNGSANSVARVVSVSANNVTMDPAMTGTYVANGLTVYRRHVKGSIISLGGSLRGISSLSTTAFTANLGIAYAFSGTSAVQANFFARRTTAGAGGSEEIKKEIRRRLLVRIAANTTLNTPTGPWVLGVPDVINLTGVFTGSNSSVYDLTKNYASMFTLDNGQRDTHYDHATITLKPTYASNTFANTFLLVEFDAFIANNTSGQGYFSVESYPVDDTATANTDATIRTWEIPSYRSTTINKDFDLRDCLDFRPYKTRTATLTQSAAGASLVNTAIQFAANTFDANTTTYKAYPNQNFECNFTHYLGRKDTLAINSEGKFIVVEGLPSLQPQYPVIDPDSMPVANVVVPPYPSLTDNEKKKAKRTDYNILLSLYQHRRYTMKDIAALDKRIGALEYYTSLSLLEKAAADLLITDSLGNDRFKNGIFADPMNNHAFSNIRDPQYRFAFDEQRGFGRPFFHPEAFSVNYDSVTSANTELTGTVVTLAYSDEAFLEQSYASDIVNPTPATLKFNGSVEIRPANWVEVEYSAQPIAISATNQATSELGEMQAPVYGSRYGWWRRIRDRAFGREDAGSTVITSPNGSTRTVIFSNTNESIGEDDVSVQATARTKEIAFKAVGLKPYTTHYAYIDERQLSYIASGTVANTSAQDNSWIARDEAWSMEIESDSRGEIVGVFCLPEGIINGGVHVFKLTNKLAADTTEESIAVSSLKINDISTTVPTKNISVANFQYSGNTSVLFGTNHSIAFTDDSVAGPGRTITAWAWDFGSKATPATSTSANPSVTFAITETSEPVKVRLTVTDDAAQTAVVEKVLPLEKLSPVPQTPTACTTPSSANVVITGFSGDTTYNGPLVASGVGSVTLALYATQDTGETGGHFFWTTSLASGSAPTSNVVSTYNAANDCYTVVLSNAGAANSVLTLSCAYRYANGLSIGTTGSFNVKVQTLDNTPTIIVRPEPVYKEMWPEKLEV